MPPATGSPSARRLTPADWGALAEAVGCLAVARLAVVLLPFDRLSRYLGEWSLPVAGARLLWRCMCLEQGLAGKLMLRRRGLANTLYLGVARDGASAGAPVIAHAWLRSGASVVTGAAGRERFAVVARFADPGRPAPTPAGRDAPA